MGNAREFLLAPQWPLVSRHLDSIVVFLLGERRDHRPFTKRGSIWILGTRVSPSGLNVWSRTSRHPPKQWSPLRDSSLGIGSSRQKPEGTPNMMDSQLSADESGGRYLGLNRSGTCFGTKLVRSFVRQNVVELGCFGRTSQCCRGRVTARNHLSNFVEVARSDEMLVRDGAVADFLRCELLLLELRVGSHAGLSVSARKPY